VKSAEWREEREEHGIAMMEKGREAARYEPGVVK